MDFKMIFPWEERGSASSPRNLDSRVQFYVSFIVLLIMGIGGLVIAIRNLRKGRVDLAGARKAGTFIFVDYSIPVLMIADLG